MRDTRCCSFVTYIISHRYIWRRSSRVARMSMPMGECYVRLHFLFEYQLIVKAFVGFLRMWMSCESQLMEQCRGPVLPCGMLEWHVGPWGTVVLLHAYRVIECASLAGQPYCLSVSYTYSKTHIKILACCCEQNTCLLLRIFMLLHLRWRFGRTAVSADIMPYLLCRASIHHMGPAPFAYMHLLVYVSSFK